MGCAPSATAVSATRAERISPSSTQRDGSGRRMKKDEEGECGNQSLRLGHLHGYLEGELAAAGWPRWLRGVAGEAIRGWVPLKLDSFQILEKIGQGTYSSVFRARNLDTGKIVALKKIHFDNFKPKSVKFMAREIQILRRLHHPNIVKLEGLIAAQLSCSLYLVFEYMEHDLAGLSSCSDFKFSESQIKCYMHQLLSGLEHCHSRGIIHRDIKGANLLVSNGGILKIADFGLANFSNLVYKQPLTSRVVTLWYRPPELLLGSTDYEPTVDLWSVGCVFAEMFLGKPILPGKTEVEQLHKFFKICGSPTDEFWEKSKLPHATIFKPHHPYESCLQEKFKCLPACAFSLLETFLSVEPHKRGTASNALASEYFRTKPYACDPSCLPNFPPSKEIDARSCKATHKKRITDSMCGPEVVGRPSGTHKTSQKLSLRSKLGMHQEESWINANGVSKPGGKLNLPNVDGDVRSFVGPHPVSTVNLPDEVWRTNHNLHRGISFSGPLHVSASSASRWVRKQKRDHPYVTSRTKLSTRTHNYGVLNTSCIEGGAINTYDLKEQANEDPVQVSDDSKGYEPYETAKHATPKKWTQLEHSASFDYSAGYHSKGLSGALYTGDAASYNNSGLVYRDQDRVEFSGPLLSQPDKADELLEKHERQIHQAVNRSRFQRAGR